MKRNFWLLLIVLLIPFVVNAKEITKKSTIKLNDSTISSYVTDNRESTYINIKKDQIITIESKENIKGLYIIYEIKGASGVISNDTLTTTFGINEFAHDYIDIFMCQGFFIFPWRLRRSGTRSSILAICVPIIFHFPSEV